jgi:hypothetical protein
MAALSDAERQRRRRARARRGEVIAPVPVCGPILDTLVTLHWLSDADAEDRAAVGRAIHAMLADLAKHK